MPSLYLPAAHSEHTPPSSPVYPSLHRQLLRRVLPLGDCEFSWHITHVLSTGAPTVGEYLPATHSMHVLVVEAPVVMEYLPEAQSVHVITTEAPVVVRYFPAAQLVHSTEPIASLYFPAAHAAHVPPSSPVCPVWQRQLFKWILPLRDCEFGGHEMHVSAVEAPAVVEYVLASQSMQKLEIKAPATVEYLPATQSMQELARKTPVSVRYLPAPHLVHSPEPRVSLYLPAAHAEHAPPSAPVYPTWH